MQRHHRLAQVRDARLPVSEHLFAVDKRQLVEQAELLLVFAADANAGLLSVRVMLRLLP